MDEQLIYTDDCTDKLEQAIALDTGALIVRRMPERTWNVNDAMQIITNPALVLVVINKLDSTSLMEISLFHFLCKPILVTTHVANTYPAVAHTVDYIDEQCSLLNNDSTFIKWFNAWKEGRWS